MPGFDDVYLPTAAPSGGFDDVYLDPQHRRRRLTSDASELAHRMQQAEQEQAPEDPSLLHMLGASITNMAGQVVGGGLERAGIVPAGTRAELQDMYESDRAARMYHHTGNLENAALLATELAPNVLPVVPAGGAGALAARGAGLLTDAPLATRLAGVAGGVAEGAGMGYLTSAGASPAEQRQSIGISGALGGLGGYLGGAHGSRPEDHAIPAGIDDLSTIQSQPNGPRLRTVADLGDTHDLFDPGELATMEPPPIERRAQPREPGAPVLSDEERAMADNINSATAPQRAANLGQRALDGNVPVGLQDSAFAGQAGFVGRPPQAPLPQRPIRDYIAGDPQAESVPIMDRAKQLWDTTYTEWIDKTQPIEKVSPEVKRAVIRARGAEDLAKGPLFEGTFVYDNSTGENHYTGESLQNIHAGSSPKDRVDIEDLMTSERQLEAHDTNNKILETRANLLAERRAQEEALRFGRKDARYSEAAYRRQYAQDLVAQRQAARAGQVATRASAPAGSDTKAAVLGAAADRASADSRLQFGDVVRANRGALALETQRARLPKAELPAPLDKADPVAFRIATEKAKATLGSLQQELGPEAYQALQDKAYRTRVWAWRANIEPLRQVGFLADDELAHLAGIAPEELAGMSADDLAHHAAVNRLYAPMFRVADKLEQADPSILVGSTKSDPIRKRSSGVAVGEGEKRMPPLEAFTLQAQRTGQWVARQQVRNAMAGAADASAGVPGSIGSEIAPARGGAPQPRTNFLGMVKKDRFDVYRDGMRIEYLAPKDMMGALEHMAPRDPPQIWRLATAPVRILRTTATTTLGFLARNPIRDGFAALVNSRYGQIPVVDLVASWVGMVAPAGSKLGEQWREYKLSGAGMSNFVSLDRPSVMARVEDVTRSADLRGHVQQFMADWGRAHWIDKALFPLQALSEIGEVGTRFSEFRLARQGGRKWMMWGEDAKLRGVKASVADAGAAARDVTLDFGRAGRSGQILNGLVAFANAELQDVDKFARNLKTRPAATAMKATVFLMVPAVLNYVKNYADKDYQARPDWEKAVYLHVAKLDDGRFIKIPRPLGLLNLAFSYGVHEALQALHSQDPTAVGDFLHAVSEQTPAHYATDPWSMVPTAARPVVEARTGDAGYDAFRNTPIVPFSEQGLLPEAQGASLPTAAQAIGSGLGVSPYKVQHVARGYLAGYGDTALNAASHLTGSRGAPPMPTTAQDIPLAKDFITRATGFDSQPIADFYQRKQDADAAQASLKKFKAEGRQAEYAAVLAEHPEAVLASKFASAAKELADLRKAHNRTRFDSSLDETQRADQLLRLGQMATIKADQFNDGLFAYLKGPH